MFKRGSESLARVVAVTSCLVFGFFLTGCDRAPAVVEHPTRPNLPPPTAVPIVPDSVPIGLSPDRLAAWTAARHSLEDAEVLYRLGVLEGEGPEVFGEIADVVISPDNHLFVLDGQAQVVRIFDPTGDFMDEFGGEGDGPEELRGAYSIAIESSGAVLVVAGRQVKVFGPTEMGYRFLESRPVPLAGGTACMTKSERLIVAGTDTRADRNVLFHEVSPRIGEPVRSFGLGYVDSSAFVRFMMAVLSPIACTYYMGTESVTHAFRSLSYVRLLKVADGSVSWTARLTDHRQMHMEGTATNFTMGQGGPSDEIVTLSPYLESHVLLQVERFEGMEQGDEGRPESTMDTYLLDLPSGRGAKVATDLPQVVGTNASQYAVVSTDPYPQIELRVIGTVEER